MIENEVPEIASGDVEIKSIARHAGVRTKVAVDTKKSDIDPVGSTVGNNFINFLFLSFFNTKYIARMWLPPRFILRDNLCPFLF